jgi:NADH:ubiquinone oxidoreductase subunit 6 (subunit J)
MQILHFTLNLVLVISSLFVLTSENPVHSILFLILVFCNASAILFLFGLEFLALAFIMIYVGAIAVLFLFVVMMLNLKIFDVKGILPYTLFVYFIAVLSWILLYFFAEFTFFGFSDPFYVDFLNVPELGSIVHHYDVNLDGISNIDALGQILYNYFTPCFLIAGLLLLVAMLGAIVLTLNFSSNRKNELCYRQLSRSDNFLSFLK